MQNTGYQKLGWKTFGVFISEKAKISIMFGLIACAFIIFKIPYVGWATLVFLLSIIITVIYTYIDYDGYGYELGEDAFKVKRGTFHKEEIAIPYRQIQNVDIERPFMYQLSGTSRLVILTAGHEDADADSMGTKAESEGIIPIIDKKLAEDLQRELLSKANIQKVIQA